MMTTSLRLLPAFFLRTAASLALALVAASACAQAPQPVIVADFNHDGIPDALVVSTSAPTATIAFGSVPYGTFISAAKAVTFPAGCTESLSGGPHTLAVPAFTPLPAGALQVGDFNGDGFPDLAFFCGGSGGTMLGNGDGTFAAAATLSGVASFNGIVGDFNKDGKLDIVVLSTVSGSNGVSQSIQYLAGNGDGTFQAPVVSNLTVNGYSTMVAADLNGDGYPDLALVVSPTNGAPQTVIVLTNNQDGTFGTLYQGLYAPSHIETIGNSTGTLTVLTGNFFGSALPDLVVAASGAADGQLYRFQNASSATQYLFYAQGTVAVPNLTAAAAGNFTGSGFPDVAVSNGTSISVLANDGAGNLSAASYPALTVASSSPLFSVADANGDGYADIYTASVGDSGSVSLAVNVTTGSATATSQPFSLSAGNRAVSAAWNGNVNLLAYTAAGQQIVTGAVTLTSLASSSNPSTFGNSVTFSVSVAPYISVETVPTGSVILMDGTTMLSSGALSNGTYSYTTSALSAATHSITAAYSGDNYFAPSTSPVLSQVVNHAAAVASTLNWATPAAIVYGTPLSGAQLNATAVDATGTAIPGTFVYTPAAGTVLDAGTRALSVTFTPTDPLSFLPATKTVALTVTQAAPVLTWPTPASIAYGVALSATQLDATATGVTGAVLPGTFTYSPAAGAVLNIGTQALSVTFVPTNTLDYTNAQDTVQLVVAPNIGATVSAPPMVTPGSQASVTVTLTQPYPTDLVGTLTIGFARTGTPQLTDPSLQFAAGGTSLSFTIPANATTIPPIQLQAGTIAGTITVPLTLTAGGVNVTPANLAPATIVVPAAAPTVSGLTITRSGDQLTVVMHGFSNTREVGVATFHFTPVAGAALGTPDLKLPVSAIFNTGWYDTTESDAYGSTFTYTQIFNTSDGAANIGSVDVTLTNSIGISTSLTAQ